MSNRLEQERELFRKKAAEAKRVLSLTPREHFNPMGFTWFQWLVVAFGLCVLLTVVAVLVRN
jgi:disulfide bond formation protein DsbB